jgi:membrane protease subunit HflC
MAVRFERIRRLAIALVALFLGLSLAGYGTLYIVDQRELAVVLQFGKPVAECTQPGLYFKVPLIQQVHKLPATRQFWGGTPKHELPDLTTRDGKKIDVIPWAVWRIKNPSVFLRRLREMPKAEERVGHFVRGAMRDIITQHNLADLVRSSDRKLTYSLRIDTQATSRSGSTTTGLPDLAPEPAEKLTLGREKILARILDEATRSFSSDASLAGEGGGRGIELVAVGIADIDFVPTVREATFRRLSALMDSIAAHYTNEGERQKQEILNRTNADVQRVEGEGAQKSSTIRGDADAEIIRQYAEAIQKAGEFYTFVRTLEAYKKALAKDTRLILTTDNDFFRLMKQADAAMPPVRPGGVPTAPAAAPSSPR